MKDQNLTVQVSIDPIFTAVSSWQERLSNDGLILIENTVLETNVLKVHMMLVSDISHYIGNTPLMVCLKQC